MTSGPGVPCGVANPAIWVLTNWYTLTAWAAGSPSYQVNQALLSNGNDSYRLAYSSGNYPDFIAGSVVASGSSVSSSSQTLAGSIQIEDTAWHFWAATYNATNHTATLYMDGVQSSAAVWTPPTVGATVSPLLIGGSPFSAEQAFIGSLAHVAIFNSIALSSARCQICMPSPLATSRRGL